MFDFAKENLQSDHDAVSSTTVVSDLKLKMRKGEHMVSSLCDDILDLALYFNGSGVFPKGCISSSSRTILQDRLISTDIKKDAMITPSSVTPTVNAQPSNNSELILHIGTNNTQDDADDVYSKIVSVAETLALT